MSLTLLQAVQGGNQDFILKLARLTQDHPESEGRPNSIYKQYGTYV